MYREDICKRGEMKLLSIVVANYNYGRFIETAIRSVLDQLDDRAELIVCDGGSDDNSVEIIKKYADRIAWWCSEKDSGQSEAFNKGFSHASGKYVTWLNADDMLVPGAVAAILAELTAHPRCEWFTGNFFRFLDSSKNVCEIGWGPHWYPNWMQRSCSPFVVFGPSSVFSRELWNRMGKIDESLHFMMDMELWMRFMVAGIKQRRIRHFVWAFRMHEESKTAEFGDHLMDPARARRFKAEAEYVFKKTGYKPSRLWRIIGLASRVFDGSLIRRAYYKNHLRTLNDVCGTIEILEKKSVGFYEFQKWFVSEVERQGVSVKKDTCIPHKIRALLGRAIGMALFRIPRRKLIVCGCHRIESCAWPWNYTHEIIPVMWDLWPGNYDAFVRFVRNNKVKTAFCTASQSVLEMKDRCPGLNIHWLPEGVDVAAYPCGDRLLARPNDLLCYGRCVPNIDEALKSIVAARGYKYVQNVGTTIEELSDALRLAKVSICYPLSDTNPAKARGVETLTLRYWEAMLSGTLIVGRAPKELIEICGYNPVIEPGEDMIGVLTHVLSNVDAYQELADKNRRTAEIRGSWATRMNKLVEEVLK